MISERLPRRPAGGSARTARDRTGKLEGTVSTFIQSQGKVEAA